jgi:hypothetical protein
MEGTNEESLAGNVEIARTSREPDRCSKKCVFPRKEEPFSTQVNSIRMFLKPGIRSIFRKAPSRGAQPSASRVASS